MVGSLVRRVGGELPQLPNRTVRQAGSEGLALDEILFHAFGDRDHRSPPGTGHGRASARSAPWSYLA